MRIRSGLSAVMVVAISLVGASSSAAFNVSLGSQYSMQITGTDFNSGVFGSSAISNLGDINNDGIGDIGIASDLAVGGGQIAVIYGRENGGTVDIGDLQSDPQATNGFVVVTLAPGPVVSGVGDTNGDGIGDFVIGDPNDGLKGSATVIYGREDFPNTVAISIDIQTDNTKGYVVQGPNSSGGSVSAFGAAVTGMGSVDDDGLTEVVVGAPGDDTGGTDAGAVFVIHGESGTSSSNFPVDPGPANRVTKIVGGAANEVAGSSLAWSEDSDSDGSPELILGAPGNISASGRRVYLVSSQLTASTTNSVSLSALPDGVFRFKGAQVDALGSAVSNAGDFDQDGSGDILFSAPGDGGGDGRAYLVFPNKLKVKDNTPTSGVCAAGTYCRAISDASSAGGKLGNSLSVSRPAGQTIPSIMVSEPGNNRAFLKTGSGNTGQIEVNANMGSDGTALAGAASGSLGGTAAKATGMAGLSGLTVPGSPDFNHDDQDDLAFADPTNGVVSIVSGSYLKYPDGIQLWEKGKPLTIVPKGQKTFFGNVNIFPGGVLPPGLLLSSTTGVITGTPTEVQPPTELGIFQDDTLERFKSHVNIQIIEPLSPAGPPSNPGAISETGAGSSPTSSSTVATGTAAGGPTACSSLARAKARSAVSSYKFLPGGGSVRVVGPEGGYVYTSARSERYRLEVRTLDGKSKPAIKKVAFSLNGKVARTVTRAPYVLKVNPNELTGNAVIISALVTPKRGKAVSARLINSVLPCKPAAFRALMSSKLKRAKSNDGFSVMTGGTDTDYPKLNETTFKLSPKIRPRVVKSLLGKRVGTLVLGLGSGKDVELALKLPKKNSATVTLLDEGGMKVTLKPSGVPILAATNIAGYNGDVKSLKITFNNKQTGLMRNPDACSTLTYGARMVDRTGRSLSLSNNVKLCTNKR